MTVTVVHINRDPQAGDDVASTNEDTAVNIDVLANDSDSDGDTITIHLCCGGLGEPDHGSVSLNSNGTIKYTPDPDFFGVDTFGYGIHDGHGGDDTAGVTVTVNPVNDAPVANNDILLVER